MSPLNCKKLLSIVLFLISIQSCQCCINEYRVLIDGTSVLAEDGTNALPSGRFSRVGKSLLLQKLHNADSIYRLTGKLEDYSDMGVLLVYTGQYVKAKQIFQEIEHTSPGLYQTAANLGTTYELLGQNDSALYWIKKAVEINPTSHHSSEWIHIKILQAKLKAKDNQKYLWEHSILSLDFGEDKIPVNKTNRDLHNLQKQLYAQLNERMYFIKPKDPIVAHLLFDLGNICALTTDVQNTLQVYQEAKHYGYTSELVDKRISYLEQVQWIGGLKRTVPDWIVIAIFLVVLIIGIDGILLLYKRTKNKIKR